MKMYNFLRVRVVRWKGKALLIWPFAFPFVFRTVDGSRGCKERS